MSALDVCVYVYVCMSLDRCLYTPLDVGRYILGTRSGGGDTEILLWGHVQVCEWMSELGPGLDPFQPAPRSPHCVVLPVITADKLL